MDSRQDSVRNFKKKHHENDRSDDNSSDNVTAPVKDKKSKRRRKERDSSTDVNSNDNSSDNSNDNVTAPMKDKKSKRRHKKRNRSSGDVNSNDNSNDDVTAPVKDKKSKRRRKKRNSSSSSDDNWVEREPASTKDGNSEKSAKQKHKKKSHKKKSKKRRKERESSDANWVECLPISTNVPNTEKPVLKRDGWMDPSQGMLRTYIKERKEPTKPNEKVNQIDAYDPSKSKYELNPYWKSNGTGLPGFQKPKADDEHDERQQLSDVRQKSTMKNQWQHSSSRNWQKPSNSNSNLNLSNAIEPDKERNASVRQKSTMNQEQYLSTRNWQSPSISNSNSNLNSIGSSSSESINLFGQSSSPRTASGEEDTDPGPNPEPQYISDEQINKLAAQQVKADLKGNTEKAARLQHELVFAKSLRAKYLKYIKETAGQQQQDAKEKQKQRPQKNQKEEEHVLLTRTDTSGNARPLMQSRQRDEASLYGGRKGEKHSKKKKKMDTHDGDGQRVRFFADDDRYSLKEMFEREKLPETAAELEAQYIRMMEKNRNPNDDIEDIFTDEQRMSIGQVNLEQRELQRAIRDHQKMTSILEDCDRCFESGKFVKDLLIATGNKIYLSLPWHVGLQKGHCILSTMEHVACSTQMDEDTWEELNIFRSALTRMFGDDIIFYEIANKLHKRPHLSIHCIPIPSTCGEFAPFYFKKAIEESEAIWSINKQVIPLGKKSLRAAVPKGLPYVWVNFGMGQGFAHVIEDQERFPATFVQEIICGMLDMEPKAWRKPLKERNPLEKVKTFKDNWKNFDCTKKMPGVTVKDIDQHAVTKAVAVFLKKTGKLKVPDQMDIIKTAKFKELAPYDPDWFYVRCASILRHLYHRSPAGVGSITKIYGGRKRNGVHPSHFCRAADGAARKALQALEHARLVEKHPEGGRKLSSIGQRDLDRIANQIVAKQRDAAKVTGPIVISK
ncbi:hypothetical protein ACLKA6_005654 [Drosophila palustris]